MTDPTPSLSRRKLLTTGALGVAAGIAASTGLAALPAAVEAAGRGPAEKAPPLDLSPVGDDVVVHVRDASTGEVALLVGTEQLVYHDPALVGRLLAGARRAQSRG